MDMSMQGSTLRSLDSYKDTVEDQVKRTVSPNAGAFTSASVASASAVISPYGIGPGVVSGVASGVGGYLPPATQPNTKKHAYTFLETAVSEMKNRAAQRDVQTDNTTASAGERSMAATVRAFNALTGKSLTEAEGWEFMILLKLVRGRQGAFRADDYVDAAAYAALLGECESTSR